MSTTALSVYAAGYSVGQQQRFYDVRGSTPTAGAVHEGIGEWHVYRDGIRLPDASAYGILDFGWIGIPGRDEVRGRFVDRAGNAGAFVTSSFPAPATPVLEVYVDPTGGSDGNAGTLALPIATRAEARARVATAITAAGQTAVVYLKRGEVHGYTGAGGEWWDGGAKAFAHQVRFVAYGTGARPIVRATASVPESTPFRTGLRGSIHLVGIEIDCVERVQGGAGNTAAINAQRNGAGTRAPLNLLVDDCVIRNATTGVLIEDDSIASDAVLAEGACDFVAMRDVTITDVGAWHMFESSGLRYVHRERVTFSRQIPLNAGLRNTDRVSNWLRSYMREMVWDTRGTDGVNGSVRFQSGNGTSTSATAWRYASYLDCDYYGTSQDLSAVGMGRKAPDDALSSTLADVRWVNLRTFTGKVNVGGGVNGGSNVDRLQFWNCSIGGNFQLGSTGAGGVINSIEIRDCATTMAGTPGLSAHIVLSSNSAARYAAGCITVTGHVAVTPSTASNCPIYYAPHLEQAQIISFINVASNRNHVGRYGDGFTPVFVYGGFLSPATTIYDLTLPAWRTARGDAGDANSTATVNSQLGIVNPGTSAANLTDFNAAYSSGTGPLDALGSSRAYSIDAGGFIRPVPNDPGPRHFGASLTPALPVVASGIEPIASWVTVGFVEVIDRTFDVSVKAAALSDAGMAAGIASVEFAVSVNGVLEDTVTVSALTLRYPDFTDEPSRMPGVAPGSLAPFSGYGFTFDPADYSAGRVEVVATVTTGNGAESVLPTLTFYNHPAAASLTLPSTRVVYLDFDSGSDANSGANWGAAVRTARRAQQLARVVTTGTTLAETDAGGARIICRGTALGGSEAGAVTIHTSEGWLTFEADPESGCRWSRAAVPSYTAGTDTIYAGAGSGTACRIRFQGIDFVGAGPVVQVGTGCTATAWQDGGTHYSRGWGGPASWSVCYTEDEGPALSFDGGVGARRYATGVDRGGCVHGFAGYSLIYDCDIHEFLGIAVQFVGTEAPSTAGAIRLRQQRYTPGVVRGYLRMDGNVGAGGTASPTLTASVTLPGILRITGPVGGYDFGTPASGLLGSSIWGVKVAGLGAQNNGTWRFLRNGVTGGAHWLELQCATATIGAAGAGAASLVTARLTDGVTYYDAIHPDGLQIFGERNGDMIFDWVMESTPSMQSYFTSGLDQSRLLVENVRDDGSGLVFNISDSRLTGCIFRNITNSGPLQSSNTEMLSCEVANCVLGSWSGVTSPDDSLSFFVANHFITGTTYGEQSTSGPWFEGSPTLPPNYSMQPSAIRIGTGTPLGNEPLAWAWNIEIPTRGVLRNVATDDWDPTRTIADITVSVTASMSGAASLRLIGAVGATLTASTEIIGAIGATPVTGAINTSVSAIMNGVGVLRAVGTITTVVDATVQMGGILGQVPVDGQITGFVGATVSAEGLLGPLPIQGEMTGSVAASVAMTGLITQILAGSISTTVSATVTMSGELSTVISRGVREQIRDLLGLRERSKRRPFWRRPWR